MSVPASQTAPETLVGSCPRCGQPALIAAEHLEGELQCGVCEHQAPGRAFMEAAQGPTSAARQAEAEAEPDFAKGSGVEPSELINSASTDREPGASSRLRLSQTGLERLIEPSDSATEAQLAPEQDSLQPAEVAPTATSSGGEATASVETPSSTQGQAVGEDSPHSEEPGISEALAPHEEVGDSPVPETRVSLEQPPDQQPPSARDSAAPSDSVEPSDAEESTPEPGARKPFRSEMKTLIGIRPNVLEGLTDAQRAVVTGKSGRQTGSGVTGNGSAAPLSDTLEAASTPSSGAAFDLVATDGPNAAALPPQRSAVDEAVAEARRTQPDGTEAALSFQAELNPSGPPQAPGRFAATLVSAAVPEVDPSGSAPVGGATEAAATSNQVPGEAVAQPGARGRRRGLDATVVSPVMPEQHAAGGNPSASQAVQVVRSSGAPISVRPSAGPNFAGSGALASGLVAPSAVAMPSPAPQSAPSSPAPPAFTGYDPGDDEFAQQLRGAKGDIRKPMMIGAALLLLLVIVVAML